MRREVVWRWRPGTGLPWWRMAGGFLMGFLAGVLAAGSVGSRMVIEDGAQQQFVERFAGIELALIFAEDRATDLPDIGDARLMRGAAELVLHSLGEPQQGSQSEQPPLSLGRDLLGGQATELATAGGLLVVASSMDINGQNLSVRSPASPRILHAPAGKPLRTPQSPTAPWRPPDEIAECSSARSPSPCHFPSHERSQNIRDDRAITIETPLHRG